MDRKYTSLLSALLLLAALQFRPTVSTGNFSGDDRLRQEAAVTTGPSGTASARSVGIEKYRTGPWAPLCAYLGSRLFSEVSVPEAQNQDLLYAVRNSVSLNTSGNDSGLSGEVGSSEESERQFTDCIARDKHAHVFRTLIVTIPDPLNTQLGLEYDRAMESLERAAAVEGYSISRYWVPWDEIYRFPQTDIEKRAATDEERRRREQEPGVLVFRQTPPADSTKVLLVFVVGERPSAGINKIAFRRAVLYSQLLPTASEPTVTCDEETINDSDLIISGPQFSGSFDSMRIALRSFSSSPMQPKCVHINSPTASNKAAREQFWRSVADDSNKSAWKVYFTVTTYDDMTRTKAMEKFFWDQYCYQPSEILFLQESSSGYTPPVSSHSQQRGALNIKCGREFDGEKEVILTFPRGIAPLRNAYQSAQESIARLSNQPLSPVLSLPLSYRELGLREQDTLPPLARDQTAVSQDAVLRQISQTVRQRRVKAAVIFATDNLDTLFLLHYLRMSNPDLLMAIPSSDSMYIRTGDPVDFHGTLVFTHLPLFSTDGSQTKFAGSMAEGTYVSVRTLLERNHSKDHKKPDLWAAAIGDDGFWPISILGPNGTNDDASDMKTGPHWMTASASDSGKELIIPGFIFLPPPKLWGILSALICLLALLHCVLCVIGIWQLRSPRMRRESQILGILRANCWPRRVRLRALTAYRIVTRSMASLHDKWFLEYYVVDPATTAGCDFHNQDENQRKEDDSENRRSQSERAFYLFVETLFVLLAQLIVVLPMWSLVKVIRLTVPSGFWLLVLAAPSMVLTSIVAVLLLSKGSQSPRWNRKVKATPRILLIWGAVVVFLIAAGFWTWVCFDPTSGKYLSQRTVFLFSGLSPALPLLLLVAGIYLWAWMNCRRIVYFETRRPDLPKLNSRNNSGIDFDEISEEFKKMLGRQLVPHSGWVFASFLFMVLTAISAGLIPRSLDGLRLDIPLTMLLTILWLMVLFAWFRFIRTWRCFRRLLRALERSPLRYAFSRLPETFSWSPVWKFGGGKRSFVIQTRSVEYMNCVTYAGAARKIRVQGALALAPLAGRNAQAEQDVRDLLTVALKREQAGLRTTGALIKRLRFSFATLANYWCQDLSLWLGKGGADGDDSEMKRRLDVPSSDSVTQDQIRLLKAEFIALRFVAYIRYISLQMRNQLLFVSVGFALALCALKTYPFQQRETISWILIGMFAVLTLGIVIVFADMDRDAILSRISNTDAGKLDWQFLSRVTSFGALPLITILASQFPSISSFLFSWIRPGLAALK